MMVVMDSGFARFTRALSDKLFALARGMTVMDRLQNDGDVADAN